MSRALRIPTALALLLAVASPSLLAAPHGTASDKSQILALEKRYNDGFNSRDVAKIMSCYLRGSELFVFDVVPPREYRGWDAYRKDWEELFAAFPGPVSNTLSEQTVTVVGSVAYGHSIQSGEFTRKDGSKLAVVARTTDIYRKVHGKWLIVEEHNSVPVDLATMKPDLLSKM
ncbi:MAG: nuclear transport factor 2 family protein [Betaproteobacteria bacterium]|nr:nuclear transport factor 2 family protein [Betaproteobacteria bacterium]MDE2002800.1 nuclear transport factor 2 family protein [Betaproteobacteria bacterium]MDE2209234.1 nuclear transport factor 2 family protein [Betaproteobacteria bacterium]MDE2358092.1 nuclear transport factor 2 family protein [Betaproteobacteria bacterium]